MRRWGLILALPLLANANVVICGSIVPDSEPQDPSGDVHGVDARTGKLIWRFHVVAQPGEFGGVSELPLYFLLQKTPSRIELWVWMPARMIIW